MDGWTKARASARRTHSSLITLGAADLVRAIDQHEIAHVDDGADALPGNEDGIFPIDGIGKRDEATDEAQVPEGDRHFAGGTAFRGEPLHDPAAEEQALAEKSRGNPDGVETHRERVMGDG